MNLTEALLGALQLIIEGFLLYFYIAIFLFLLFSNQTNFFENFSASCNFFNKNDTDCINLKIK
jgi:hypothetical protein